jgi:DNA-binding NarL/FixJ family response regulator
MSEAGTRRDTILVVDDTPETLGFLMDTLDGAGYTVLIATDGESALSLVDQITPDLVLMDALMPGLDGFETCRRLKQERLLGYLPVIFMTGLSDTEHVVRGLSAGGVDYVPKPIVVEELLARIKVHLVNARSARGSRAALDAAGRFLLASDRRGQVLWCTPKARQLLGERPSGDDSEPWRLPDSVVAKLLAGRPVGTQPSSVVVDLQGRQVEFTMLSPLGPQELLIRLSERVAGGEQNLLQHLLGVTGREADVLLWISRGKSNREIGEILAISPRTVNKHLEQVFVKLGVENRASAAARAVRALSRQA